MFNVVLIEDDRNTARMVGKILDSNAFTLHHASDGLTGLRLAREVDPDIILVDMDLPDLEGKVVVSSLRRWQKLANVPIIAFTAEDSARARRLALGFGCDGFISKPIDTRKFPGTLTEIIARSKEKQPDVRQANTLY